MLQRIKAKNFFVFEDFSIDFPAAMIALTGETGTGKSMVLHSMNLVLGASFAYDLIRDKTQESQLELTFVMNNPAIRKWLTSQHIDPKPNHSLVLSRSAWYKKSSRACCNGQTIELAAMRQLSEHLIEIHGQQKQSRLSSRRGQLAALDEYCQTGQQISKVARAAQAIQKIKADIENIESHSAEAMELVQYQLDEIEAENIGRSEWGQLQATHKKLANLDQYLSHLAQLENLLHGDDVSLSQLVKQAKDIAIELVESDPKIDDLKQTLERAQIEIEEADSILLRFQNMDTENAQEQLTQTETRMAVFYRLARKHQVEPQDLWLAAEQLRQRLELSQNRQKRKEVLVQEYQAWQKKWQKAAEALGQMRREHVVRLCKQVNQYLAALNMPYADFKIEFEQRPHDQFHPSGGEWVHYLISTVKDRPHEPIERIASGGELSRISLAVQLCASRQAKTNKKTLIFDEIDAGIGGQSADQLGKMLAKLAQTQQLMCVTHLATVAAYATCQYQIHTINKRQEAGIRLLQPQERQQELARMLTGNQSSKSSLEAAADLLKRAELAHAEKPSPRSPTSRKSSAKASS